MGGFELWLDIKKGDNHNNTCVLLCLQYNASSLQESSFKRIKINKKEPTDCGKN